MSVRCSNGGGPLCAFRVERAQVADVPEIVEFLFTDFLVNEPLNSALDLTREEAVVLFEESVVESLADNLSYLVRDPAKGQIVAVRLANIVRRCGHTTATANGGGASIGHALDANRAQNEKARKISSVLSSLEAKIWELVPAEADTLLCIMILSVHADYQRKGIAAALMEHRLDEAVASGCQGCVTEASALNSQRLFRKLGYSRLHELKHAQWRDQNGEQVFRCKDGTDSITIEFKQF